MSRGIARERQLRHELEADGFLVVRAAGSLGIADLIALRAGDKPWLIEVKTDGKGPFDHFRPERRAALSVAAERAGGTAWLVWWPPRRKQVWMPESTWPEPRAEGMAEAPPHVQG